MATTTYSWDEIRKHNTAESLWVVIDGNVYDVTKFKEEHPGGEEVLQENAGSDATQAFKDVGHSEDAIELRKKYHIGVVDTGPDCCTRTYNRLKLIVPPILVVALAVGIGILIYKKYKN